MPDSGLADMVGGVDEQGRRIDSLQLSFEGLRAESHEGTAIAISLGGMQIPHGKDSAFSLRLGHYRSGLAVAASGAFRLPPGAFSLPDGTFGLTGDVATVVDFGVAHGMEYSRTGSTAGITWGW